MCCRPSSSWASATTSRRRALERPLPYKSWAWFGFVLGVVRVGDGGAHRFRGPGDRALHLLPAADRQPLLLHRARARGRGLVDLVRRDDARHGAVEGGEPGRARAARHVRDGRQRRDVALDHDRRRGGARVQIIPASLGFNASIDVGLSRTLFSWTLHAIVYFWLIPAYIAFYTMAPQAAGGRLYSDTMGRLTFILFLIYSLPVGIHHLLMDPQHSNAFKFLQMSFTALVAAPTLLTVFTIAASMEIAGRLRGGRGLFGWIWALPWERPMVLATGLAFFMLWFGGGGGLINMSYGMNAMVHNTSWVTAHFHLIFGGTVVIMYFAIAYAIWPVLTGRTPASLRNQRLQLWLWFAGMMVMTLPWHYLGLQGQWRRVATFNYADPIIAAWGPWVIVSFVGGAILLASALLFVWNLLEFHRARAVAAAGLRPLYALAVHPPLRVPASLNGFSLWNVLVLVLMLAAYGYPIAQFFILKPPQAIVHRVDGTG